ncbi:MAG: aldehyde dehydrogenase family protein [Bacteroidetes bacterium]|nr:aldehyde dehydrogenase family protein [Bacteroidota bacterium]
MRISISGISPFNFPLNLAAHKIAPALAAGNPIIIKPSSKTPVSILRLAELVHDDFLPDGAFSVLPMERKLGDKLITDERIKLLSFTGSPAVGWAMKNKAGKKRVLLELGGNAGVYVGDTADVGLAIKRCITGGYAYSGQVCIHVQRIFVHHKVFESFITGFVKGVEGLKVGSPDDPQTDISTMIDEDNAKRVEKWVNDALDQGAELLHGGERSGGYYPPTVLTGTNNKMKVCAEEVFGPVVTVESVESFDQGMDLINDSQYGLQAGVFTNRLDEMDRAFAGLEVGGIIINDMPTFRVDHMPYGGVKNSGFGREGVRYAIQEMTEPRLLVKSKAD